MGTPFAVAASCLRLQQSHAASTRSIEPKVPHVPGAWRPLRGIVPSVRLAKDRVQGSLMFGRADGRRRIASRQSPISWVIDRGEGVRRACGHRMESTRFNAVSLVTVLSVQPSAEDIERLVTSMVDVEARLVTGIRVL